MQSIQKLGVDQTDKIVVVEFLPGKYMLLDGNNRLCAQSLIHADEEFEVSANVLWPVL